jgi:hypothetical protein
MLRPGGKGQGAKISGSPSGEACAAGGITLRVEEEFVLALAEARCGTPAAVMPSPRIAPICIPADEQRRVA